MRLNPRLNFNRWMPAFFIVPVVVGLFCLNYIPSFYAFFLSFQHWNLLEPPQWVGLENYHQLLASPAFYQTIRHTAWYVGGVVIFELLFSLVIATALHRITKGKRLFQVLAFLPYVTPAMAASLIFMWIFQPEQGLLNSSLQAVGLLKSPIAWLFTPNTALVAVMSLEVWKATGYNMLLILGALQALPQHIDEAATLDGASGVRKWWWVTLPQLMPTLLLVGMMTTIHALQAFDAIYLLTQGGPNRATTVLAYALYETAFQRFEIGQATALGFIIFTIIAVLTLMQWKLTQRKQATWDKV